jgi:hypothetical protein
MMNLIVIALSLTTGAPAKSMSACMTVHQQVNGDFAVRYTTAGRSTHARNKWDTTRIASDEGNNGIGPRVERKSF